MNHQRDILEYIRNRPVARYTQKFLMWARATLRQHSDPLLISREEPEYVYKDWYDDMPIAQPFKVSSSIIG